MNIVKVLCVARTSNVVAVVRDLPCERLTFASSRRVVVSRRSEGRLET